MAGVQGDGYWMDTEQPEVEEFDVLLRRRRSPTPDSESAGGSVFRQTTESPMAEPNTSTVHRNQQEQVNSMALSPGGMDVHHVGHQQLRGPAPVLQPRSTPWHRVLLGLS